MRRAPVTLSCLALLVATGACGGGDGGGEAATTSRAEGGDGIEVVASFYPLAEVAQRVGGERVRVENLTPAGAEPHDLELTPSQVEELEDADVAVVMGRGFQPGVEAVAERRSGGTLEVLRALPIEQDGEVAEEEAGGGEGIDPHVWLDPVLMQEVVDEARDALVAADPEGEEGYRDRAEAYRQEVGALDARYREGLGNCERRTIVTSHEAFGRLAGRYGLEQRGIAGLSPDAEPNPERLSELADMVRQDGITTIFTETLVSPRVAETLARETGAKTAVLDPLEGLSDREIAAGETYVTVMGANLEHLRAALGCR